MRAAFPKHKASNYFTLFPTRCPLSAPLGFGNSARGPAGIPRLAPAGPSQALTEQNPDWGVHDCPALPSANGSIFWPIANSGKDFRMSKLVVAFAFFCTGLSLASAQGGRLGTPQEQQACTRDASRYCRQQLGDDASVQQCLRQHRHRLSSACQKVFQSHGQ